MRVAPLGAAVRRERELRVDGVVRDRRQVDRHRRPRSAAAAGLGDAVHDRARVDDRRSVDNRTRARRATTGRLPLSSSTVRYTPARKSCASVASTPSRATSSATSAGATSGVPHQLGVGRLAHGKRLVHQIDETPAASGQAPPHRGARLFERDRGAQEAGKIAQEARADTQVVGGQPGRASHREPAQGAARWSTVTSCVLRVS